MTPVDPQEELAANWEHGRAAGRDASDLSDENVAPAAANRDEQQEQLAANWELARIAGLDTSEATDAGAAPAANRDAELEELHANRERARFEGRDPSEVSDEERFLRDAETSVLSPEAAERERKLAKVMAGFRNDAMFAMGMRTPLGTVDIPIEQIRLPDICDYKDERAQANIERLSWLPPEKIVPVTVVQVAPQVYLLEHGGKRIQAIARRAERDRAEWGTIMVPARVIQGNAVTAIAGYFRHNRGMNGINPLTITKAEKIRGARLLLDIPVSNSLIAKIVHVTEGTIRYWKRTKWPDYSEITNGGEVWTQRGWRDVRGIGDWMFKPFKTEDTNAANTDAPDPVAADITATLDALEGEAEKPGKPGWKIKSGQNVEVILDGKSIGRRWSPIQAVETADGKVEEIQVPWKTLPNVSRFKFRGEDGKFFQISGTHRVSGQKLAIIGTVEPLASAASKPKAPAEPTDDKSKGPL